MGVFICSGWAGHTVFSLSSWYGDRGPPHCSGRDPSWTQARLLCSRLRDHTQDKGEQGSRDHPLADGNLGSLLQSCPCLTWRGLTAGGRAGRLEHGGGCRGCRMWWSPGGCCGICSLMGSKALLQGEQWMHLGLARNQPKSAGIGSRVMVWGGAHGLGPFPTPLPHTHHWP